MLVAGCVHTQDVGMAIQRGTLLEVTTARGDRVLMRATSAAMRGRDFPVVWVCTPDEFQRSETDGTEPDAIPWPLDALAEREPAHR